MSMILLRKLDNRFQADLWRDALATEGIPHRFRTFMDQAYDGLFVSQKGYGDIHVEQEWLAQAQRIDQELSRLVEQPPDSATALAGAVEHTLLDPEATRQDLAAHLDECTRYGVVAACVSPWMVEAAAERLADSPVRVCGVLGFPLGTQSAATKTAEAAELAAAGADELDLVINRGLALGHDPRGLEAEVAGVRHAAPEAALKVILEISRIPDERLDLIVEACLKAGADYLKTGSGYFGGATAEQVERLLLAVERAGLPRPGIKAAGGIRDLDRALDLLEAGADRLGTSAGAAIMAEARKRWPDPA